MPISPIELARKIDHTLLKPDATRDAIQQHCAEARTHGFFSVCIQPCWVHTAASLLSDSGVVVCTVVGFPHGANTAQTKAFEAFEATQHGAKELDMVINIGAAKSGDWAQVEADIAAVVDVAHSNHAEVKVILECALLTQDEMRQATEIVAASGAAFVKTSTGYAAHGARVEDVRLMREIVGKRCGVKAAGGIRDLPAALAMLEAGANRLGTSSGIAIIESLRAGS
jgi:deoxyribose-phosphate aldolase